MYSNLYVQALCSGKDLCLLSGFLKNNTVINYKCDVKNVFGSLCQGLLIISGCKTIHNAKSYLALRLPTYQNIKLPPCIKFRGCYMIQKVGKTF